MFRKLFRKFFPNKTATDFPGGYIPNRFFMDRVKKPPILIIGDYTGRDYKSLKEKFGEVYLLDVVDNKIAEGKYFIHQSVTKKIPFPDGYFCYIIISEVIEHVWEDKKALEELNRVLKKKGNLILTVPFYSDKLEFHYHIYSFKSIQRLLEHSGFEIINFSFKGLITSIPNSLVAFLAILIYPLFRERSLNVINEILYKIHIVIGKLKLNKLSQKFGVLIITQKELKKSKIDPIKIQEKEFKR